MGDRTGIAWTDATWNIVRGCSRVSAGCTHCFAERDAGRMSSGAYRGLVKKVGSEWRWTGEVRFIPELLDLPLRWRRPRRIFVDSMSDLFHEKVHIDWLDQIVGIMGACDRHTYHVLTKRPERMYEYVIDWQRRVHELWPRHIWLGVSLEDQATADARIPWLLRTPAALRFVSYEPALGPVDFGGFPCHSHHTDCSPKCNGKPGLSWLIIGGESGPGHRPMEIAWVESAVEQCHAAGVPIFVKQDSGPRPGQQGRIPDRLWLKEFPA